MDKPSKLVQEWLKFSRQDLLAAKALFQLKNPEMYRNVGFHCQQTVEKVFKALLTFRKCRYEKTHDLELLGLEILRIYPHLNPILLEAKKLTPFAVEFRYPDSSKRELTADILQEALNTAEKVQQAIVEILK